MQRKRKRRPRFLQSAEGDFAQGRELRKPTPEQALLFELVKRQITDACRPRAKNVTPDQAQETRSALHWIMAEDSRKGWPRYSFECVCAHVYLDPAYIRAHVRKVRAGRSTLDLRRLLRFANTEVVAA